MTRFLVFANLRVAESTTYATSEGGYRSLLDADKGSLIGIIQQRVPGRPSLPFILIGFDIWQSNWPNGHYSFPIFFADSLSWLMRSQRGVEQSRFRSGEALRVHWSSQRDADAAKGIRFRAPSGKMLIPNVAEDGSLVLASARELGIYDVVREGEVLTSLPVGLLNATESRLHPREKLDFGAYEVTASAGPQESLRELWKWFAALALLVVVTEWLIYNRRLAVS